MSPVPTRIGKYEIERRIGSGGFGVVYKARDPALDRDVAIKVLRTDQADDDETTKRFYREARGAAALRHPHIVTIYDFSQTEDGTPYIVMEYLPGRSLKDFCQHDTLSTDQTLVILKQIGEALDYAHAQQIVHRDVKPENVMVDQREDGSLDCVLTDFGLVKILESSDVVTSSPLGTFEYMAPEQIAPEQYGPVSPATDLYALGILAYRMFTGQVPFHGSTATVLSGHLYTYPADPSTVCSSVSPEVAAVLQRSLSKPPADRYPCAADMVSSLREALAPTLIFGSMFELDEPFWEETARTKELDLAYPEMIGIPEGPCWIGSDVDDPEANANETPRHTVHLALYTISKYPITNAQYRVFVEQTGHASPGNWPDGQIPPDKEHHPVTDVNRQDAADYCLWLSQARGHPYRLPTEFEWEKAARGGDPETRSYPWGDRWLQGHCNSAQEGHQDTTPVDAYRDRNRSPYGIVDTVGNVWEWTDSLYRRYPGSDYDSASYGTAYVVHGGSWRNPPEDARISNRGRYRSGVKRPYLGFRIVQPIEL